ncbi:hypothetical protein Asi02nite_16680 [Asanoa siamensis]|uniref:Hsp70 protein n=1 Tax=Asanoa siamensis TaxID=926357 RepID=A0ABQ4CLJ7_9ACTN|nr:hypothetical protein Asi02nite_16680 [Asanoa siamensis]
MPLLDEDAPLGREQLDALARPLIDRTVAACRAALAAAGVGPTHVFLVGGASRYPLVSTALHQALGIIPTAAEQPELAVAEGAVRPLPVESGAGAPTPGSPVRRRRSRRGVVLVAGLAVVAVSAGTALAFRPDGRGVAQELVAPATHAASSVATPTSTPTPTPTPSVAAGVDPCLVGRWQAVSYHQPGVNMWGTKVDLGLSGKGWFVNYLADGTGWTDYRAEGNKSGRAGGKTYRVTHKGTVTWRHKTVGDKLVITSVRNSGTTTWRVNGSVRVSAALTQDPEADPSASYRCDDDELTVVDNVNSETYRRIGLAQPPPR